MNVILSNRNWQERHSRFSLSVRFVSECSEVDALRCRVLLQAFNINAIYSFTLAAYSSNKQSSDCLFNHPNWSSG